jgi:hypothetical protein
VPDCFNLQTQVVGDGSINKTPTQSCYQDGSSVTLEAVPDPGWQFDEWQGDLTGNTNPDTVTMDSDKSVTGVFIPLFNLTIIIEGNGNVNVNPVKPLGYEDGDIVTLTAIPGGGGWLFDRWEIDLTGSVNPESLLMNSDKTVRAVFVFPT